MNPNQGRPPDPYRAQQQGSNQPPPRQPVQGGPPPQQPAGAQPPNAAYPQQWHQPPPPPQQPPQPAPGPGQAAQGQHQAAQGQPQAAPQPAQAPNTVPTGPPQASGPVGQPSAPPAGQPSAPQGPSAVGPQAPAGAAPHHPGGPGTAARQRLRPAAVGSLLQTDVVEVEPDTPVRTVVAKMAERDVGSVVVTDDGAPVGVLTDRAIALTLETDPDVADRQAADLVSGEVITGTVDMDVSDALGRLQEGGVRRLPILDEEGSLEGIVTLDDILIELAREFQQATSIIESQARD